MKVSEFVYTAVMDKLETNKINDSQSQFFQLYDNAFRRSFDSYFKHLMVVNNRVEFNTQWLLKQQDIFMQHLKVPNTIEELNTPVIDHAITEKARELVIKELRSMSMKKKELKDE